MSELVIVALIVTFGVVIIAFMVIQYLQGKRMQDLLKARDLPEFYKVNKKKGQSLPTDPNRIAKEEPNEIDLTDDKLFVLPEEFKVQFEGEEETRDIRIFRDGSVANG